MGLCGEWGGGDEWGLTGRGWCVRGGEWWVKGGEWRGELRGVWEVELVGGRRWLGGGKEWWVRSGGVGLGVWRCLQCKYFFISVANPDLSRTELFVLIQILYTSDPDSAIGFNL